MSYLKGGTYGLYPIYVDTVSRKFAGWAQDTGHNWEALRITLVILEKESRYLKHCGPVPDEHFPILREKGIAIKLKQSH